jgi:anti-sigma factor RsiW
MDISRRDWQLLSEYIDGELSERKRIRLEGRFESERALRDALRKIKNTQRILRATPHLSAPKDFILTPDMIPQEEKRSFFPVFRLATAVVSILLIAVLVLDFGKTIFPMRGAEYAAPAVQEEMLEKAGEVDQAVIEETELAEEPQLEKRAEGVEMEMEEDVEASEEAEALAMGEMTETPPVTITVSPTPTLKPPPPTPSPALVEERGGLPWIRVVEIILAGFVVLGIIGMVWSRKGRRDAS